MPVYRSDQAAIHVNLAGITIDNEVWDTFEGGDITADTTNYLPGGMRPALELGGLPKRGDITVTRIWSDVLIGVYKTLDNGCGRVTGTVSYTPMNVNGSTAGQPTFTYTVVLKGVTRPNYDSSTSGEAKLQLVFGANGAMN